MKNSLLGLLGILLLLGAGCDKNLPSPVVSEPNPPATTEPTLTATECGSSHSSEDQTFWRKKFLDSHPKIKELNSVGSYCKLSDSSSIRTFSYIATEPKASLRQAIIWFDLNNKNYKEIHTLLCEPNPDLFAPVLSPLPGEKILIDCVAGKGEKYELNLLTFTYQ